MSFTASQLLHCQGVLKLMNAYMRPMQLYWLETVRASEVSFEHVVGDFVTNETISISVTTG